MEFLIPQKIVADTCTGNLNPAGIKNVQMDEILASRLKDRFSFKARTAEGEPSKILIKSSEIYFITTSAAVSLKDIELKDFSLLSDFAGKFFSSRGIDAFAFCGSKVRILLDIDLFLSAGRAI